VFYANRINAAPFSQKCELSELRIRVGDFAELQRKGRRWNFLRKLRHGLGVGDYEFDVVDGFGPVYTTRVNRPRPAGLAQDIAAQGSVVEVKVDVGAVVWQVDVMEVVIAIEEGRIFGDDVFELGHVGPELGDITVHVRFVVCFGFVGRFGGIA